MFKNMSKILASNIYDLNYTYVIISGDINRLNTILKKECDCIFDDSDVNKYVIVLNEKAIFMFVKIPNTIISSVKSTVEYLNTIKSRNITKIMIDDPKRAGSFQKTNRWISNMISTTFIQQCDYVIAAYF